jgi:hypothetical protein
MVRTLLSNSPPSCDTIGSLFSLLGVVSASNPVFLLNPRKVSRGKASLSIHVCDIVLRADSNKSNVSSGHPFTPSRCSLLRESISTDEHIWAYPECVLSVVLFRISYGSGIAVRIPPTTVLTEFIATGDLYQYLFDHQHHCIVRPPYITIDSL